MGVQIGHASIDENGRTHGGEPGDQTKREVLIRDWYPHNWNKLIRPKSRKVAGVMAQKMRDACVNDHIGYNQDKRTTLFELAEKNRWDIKGIRTKCDTDCSALVAVCVNAAGIRVSRDMYTGNEANVLKQTGQFDILTDSKYLNREDYLMKGDILLAEGHHTAIVLTDGSKADARPVKPQEKKKPVKPQGKKTIAEVVQEVIDGKWGDNPKRRELLRSKGYDPDLIQKRVNEKLAHK